MLINVNPGSRQKACEPWTLEKLYHERCLALGSAIDMSTLGPYNSALNSYITFCKIHNFPIKPTGDTMSYFVVFMSAYIKPDSVSTCLGSVTALKTSFLTFARSGTCQLLKGSKVKCKSLLSHDDIHHAISTLGQSSDYNDCLFLALLVTGFNGLLKIIHRTSIEWLPEGYAFFLPVHKADTAFEGNKSMHAGSATDLAEQGVLPYIIQAHRHWSFSAFKIYI
ncbi:hypothetical protein ARMGADRAFT_1043994 [Armillaria gallica]|uniref:Ndc10 domain-containing protein n=1 Tax=Armillaria gallica TaxID=47427 RepID=A0A2H3DSG7_ARMGA|nr:hypothetical protein ARMGADRAFT_1043994 [Armillaria gallica]